jgi:hypothetical protein
VSPRTGGGGERALVLLIRYVLLPSRNVGGSSRFGCGISRRRIRRRCRGLLGRGRPRLLFGGRLVGRGSVRRVWGRLFDFGRGGSPDVCRGLFGLLSLLDEDESKVVSKDRKRRTDGVCGFFGLRGHGLHVQQRAGRPPKTTGNGWGSESGRRGRRIHGGGDSHGNNTNV